MSKGKKIGLGILIVFVVVIIGLAVAIPLLINIDRYRPQVIAHIQEETGKPAEIGRLALTIFPTLSIRVDDFALGNPPGFPKGYLVKTRRIYAVVDRGALWNRQVIIKSLELDEPVIRLLSAGRRVLMKRPSTSSKIDIRRCSFPSKYRYRVPSATSAWEATSVILAAKYPFEAKTSMAARRIRFRFCSRGVNSRLCSLSGMRPPTE